MRSAVLGLVLLAAIPGARGSSAAGPDFAFMPPGGKSLFLAFFGKGPPPEIFAALSGPRKDQAQWGVALKDRHLDATERQLQTLAAYLSVNTPLQAAELQEALARGDLAAALPPDGREIAWNGCQSCHSLFSGYLTQRLDVNGWQNKFQAPFHAQLKMTAREREEFSTYSAINMPMKVEDVPEELRF